MRLLFFDNSTGLKTVHDLKTRARGGMISSLFTITDLLSGMGHEVIVIGGIETGGTTDAGVRWRRMDEGFEAPVDVLVCNRTTTHDGFASIRAKHRILWTHDLPHSGFIPNKKIVKSYKKVVFMSRYAERVWRTFYPEIEKSVLIPNGVDRELFYPRKKDLDYLIFGSAPNRGLQYLQLIFDALKNRVSDSLYLNAYSNRDVLHPNEPTHHEINMIEKYEFTGENAINLLDPLPQKMWAEELGKAGMMILPTAYPEICSNAILQALASGTPIVTTGNLGSAPEWVKSGWNGFLTQFLPNDYMVHTLEIVKGAKEILESNKMHKKLIKNAVNTKGILSWDEVAKKWNKMLRGL